MSATWEHWEKPAEFYMSPDTAAERDELRRQLDTLRKRNEKLERLLREARNCRDNCSPVRRMYRYDVDYEAFSELLDALSALDKGEQ